MTDAVATRLPAPGTFERFKNSCGKTWKWLKVDASNAMAKRVGWYGTGTLLLTIVALATWGIVVMNQRIFAETYSVFDANNVKVMVSYGLEANLVGCILFDVVSGIPTLLILVLGLGAVRKGHKYGNFVLPPQDDNLNNNNL